VVETVEALSAERGAEDKLWGSMVKQGVEAAQAGFNESYYGFRSFGKLLEEAQARKLLTLEPDEKSGGVIVKTLQHGITAIDTEAYASIHPASRAPCREPARRWLQPPLPPSRARDCSCSPSSLRCSR